LQASLELPKKIIAGILPDLTKDHWRNSNCLRNDCTELDHTKNIIDKTLTGCSNTRHLNVFPKKIIGETLTGSAITALKSSSLTTC
jgi:hypothetical protein